MTQNEILIILIGIPLTLFLMWLYDKLSNRKPEKGISFETISCQSYNNKKEGIVHLQVVYDGKQLEKSIVILNGRFTNTGKKDIKYDNVFTNDITLSFDDNFKIIDFKLISSNDKIGAQIGFNDGIPTLRWSLMKRKESFDVQIIAEYENESQNIEYQTFNNSIKFDFRANGIDKIKASNLGTKNKHSMVTTLGAAYTIFGLTLLLVYYCSYSSLTNAYTVNYNEGTYYDCNIKHSLQSDAILIKNDETKFKIPRCDFNNTITIIGIEEEGTISDTIVFFWFGLVLSFAGIALIIVSISLKNKHRNKIRHSLINHMFEDTFLLTNRAGDKANCQTNS